MNKIFKAAAFVLAAWMIVGGCKKTEEITPSDPPPPNNNTAPLVPTSMTARDSVALDYNANYLGSAISSPGWTGSTSSCSAGGVPQATNDAIIKRINYFRRLVGLNDNCTLDASKFSQEQQAALMMKANYAISHSPPSSWTCYTSEGATGASSSNLALGVSASAAITAFIFDDGGGNEPVGHRRWIFRSSATSFSCGSTDVSMALYVFGTGGNTKIPQFIAYPTKGYMPQQLVPSRWSFSIPGANFASASVTMSGPSGSVPLTVISNNMVGYADNTIVWVPTGINTTSTNDVSYTVTINGVGNTSQSSYTYNVTLIKP